MHRENESNYGPLFGHYVPEPKKKETSHQQPEQRRHSVMNPSDAMIHLKALGYIIDCGYVFNGKYRYGRILEDAFIPESDSAVPIQWTDVVEFHSYDQGSFGSCLMIVKTRVHNRVVNRRINAFEKVSNYQC